MPRSKRRKPSKLQILNQKTFMLRGRLGNSMALINDIIRVYPELEDIRPTIKQISHIKDKMIQAYEDKKKELS